MYFGDRPVSDLEWLEETNRVQRLLLRTALRDRRVLRDHPAALFDV